MPTAISGAVWAVSVRPVRERENREEKRELPTYARTETVLCKAKDAVEISTTVPWSSRTAEGSRPPRQQLDHDMSIAF